MHHNGNRGDNCIQEGRGRKEYRRVHRILAWAPSYSFGGNKERGTVLRVGRKVWFLTQSV